MKTLFTILLSLLSLQSHGALLNKPVTICSLKDDFSKLDLFIYKTSDQQNFEVEVRDYVDRDSKEFRKYISKNFKLNPDNKRKTIEVLQGRLENGQPITLARRVLQRSLTNTEPQTQFAAFSAPSLFSKNVAMVCNPAP